MKNKFDIKLYLVLTLALAFGVCSAQNGSGEVVAMDNEDNGTAAATEVITEATHVFAPVYHKVAEGETVESVMKQFGMNKYQFNTWNKLPDGFKPGVNVVVKYRWYKKSEVDASTLADDKTVALHRISPVENIGGGGNTAENASANTGGNVSGNTVYHRIEAGETLSRIAVAYHVSITQLKTWNKLSDDKIKLNRNLIVGM